MPTIIYPENDFNLLTESLSNIPLPNFFQTDDHIKLLLLKSDNKAAKDLILLPPDMKERALNEAVKKFRTKQNYNWFQIILQNFLLFFISLFNSDLKKVIDDQIKTEFTFVPEETLKREIPFHHIARKVNSTTIEQLLGQDVKVHRKDDARVWELKKGEKIYGFSTDKGIIELKGIEVRGQAMPLIIRNDDESYTLSGFMIDSNNLYAAFTVTSTPSLGPTIHIEAETYECLIRSLKNLPGSPAGDFYRECRQKDFIFEGFEEPNQLLKNAKSLKQTESDPFSHIFGQQATAQQIQAMNSNGYAFQGPLFLPMEYAQQTFGIYCQPEEEGRKSSIIKNVDGTISFQTHLGLHYSCNFFNDYYYSPDHGCLQTAHNIEFISKNGKITPVTAGTFQKRQRLPIIERALCTQTFRPDGTVDIKSNLVMHKNATEFLKLFKEALSIEAIIETLRNGTYPTQKFNQLVTRFGFNPSETLLRQIICQVLSVIPEPIKQNADLAKISQSLNDGDPRYKQALSSAFDLSKQDPLTRDNPGDKNLRLRS
ncbi:MAG: hypothetical protein FJ186_05445 [Gammaproteobacteria bacterium]|nr:hypothetical protein [Gammaproteobacteria bacterium]